MLRGDVGGRVPFSLVAVIALVLAGLSSVYVATTAREASDASVQTMRLRVLGSVAEAVHRGVGIEAHGLALEAIHAVSDGPWDPRRANAEFGELVEARLTPSFPRTVRGYTIELDGFTAGLFLESLQTMDVVPSGGRVTETRGNLSVEAVDTARSGLYGETSRTPYFRLVGTANYTIRGGGLVLQAGFPLSGTIDSPFPLLQSAAEGFRGAVEGPQSELARLVRYILTTAAQFRALQGFAVERYGEPGTTTADILGPEDVEIAVNLALLLEELRHFREVDDRSPVTLDANHYADRAGRHLDQGLLPDASERTMARLLEAYARGGSADAADLFALYGAFDADPLRLNRILAQAIAAVQDQEVLRILSYYGIEWVVDLSLTAAESLARDIDGFLGWITGESREGELVKGYVRELFGMAGEATSLLGPFPVSLPAREYRAKGGDGRTYNVSVPVHATTVDFDRVDMLADRDALWRSYYTTLFAGDLRAVHESARDFLTDLASNVANNLNLIGSIPNPTLRGAIGPKDGESILEFAERSLNAALDDALARLRGDPRYLDALVANLWEAQARAVRGLVDFIAANYDALASRTEESSIAASRLAVHLESWAAADPDYHALDAAGLADLRTAIVADVEGMAWVPTAFEGAKVRDAARFERVYVVATDASTPPEGGGIYQRLLATVVGATGVLSEAGALLKAYGDALTASDDLQNVKVLTETPAPPFEFWSGNRTVAEAGNAVREETVVVRQTPAALLTSRRGDSDVWDRHDLRIGDLWVDVWDPTAFSRSAGRNVHWTNITSMSERPFETRWDVRVAGLAALDVSSARGVRLGPDGHVPEVASETVRIDLSFTITVYTGWPLRGVEYADSNTLAADTWAFLQQLFGVWWHYAEPAVDWILDGIQQFVEYVVDLIHRAMSSDVVRAINEVVQTTVEALQNLTRAVLAPAQAALEDLAESVQGRNVTAEMAGMHLSFAGSPTGHNATVNLWAEGREAHVTFLVGIRPPDGRPWSLQNSPVNLLFTAASRVGDTVVTLAGDLLMVLQGRFLTARAVPDGGGWALDLVVPAIDAYQVETPWEFTLPPLPTPLGTLTLSLGAEVRYSVSTSVPWLRLLGDAFAGALSELGLPRSWNDVGGLLKAFLTRLIESFLDYLVTGIIRLKEFVFYLEGVLGAASTGAGFRLAFVIDGQFVVRVLRWVMHNIAEFLTNLPRPSATAHYEEFPPDLLDFLSLRVEFFATAGLPWCIARAVPEEIPARIRVSVRVEPNLPALANYWAPELGRWRVGFGVYLEQVPAPIADVLFRTGDATPDVWFLKGAVYET